MKSKANGFNWENNNETQPEKRLLFFSDQKNPIRKTLRPSKKQKARKTGIYKIYEGVQSMKSREDKIKELIEKKIEFWYEWRPYEIADLFRGGLKGYDQMTDEAINEEYNIHFEEE
jgi:hypothetical protein